MVFAACRKLNVVMASIAKLELSGRSSLAAQDLRQRRQQPVDLPVCAHGDPQIVGDAGPSKMADDHRPLAQCGGERCALLRRMTRKDKIGGGRQYLEAK